MKPTLGLRFEHLEQLKDCLTNYCVANGYQIRYRRNDYRSLFVLCGRDLAEGRSGGKKGKKGDWPYKKEKDEDELLKKDKGKLLRTHKKGTKKVVSGCTFRLWASWMQDGSYFQIKTLVPEHTCSRNFELGSLVTFKWIAKQFAFKIIHDLTITYRHIEHYSRLWDYRKQLLDTNPGSSVHLHVDEKEDASTVQHNFYSKMNLIRNIDPEAKQWLVDRNPNSWCRAFFKMDRGCAAYENSIFESYHNSIRIARDSITPSIRKEIERLKHSQRYWTVYPCGNNVFKVRKGDDSYGVNIDNRTCACKCYFIKPVGGSSMWPQTLEEPHLPPVLRKMSDGGDTDPYSTGPSVGDPSSAGPSVCDPSFVGPSVGDPSSAGPSVGDPSSTCPSVADSTSSGTQTITEDPIVADPIDDIPTQQICRIIGSSHTQWVGGEPRCWLRLDDEEDILGYMRFLSVKQVECLRSKEDDVQKISSRSKIGKRFRFVRFINVFDMERLVNNLCTVWIGKLKLHANVARYQRDSGKNNYQRLNKGTNVSNGGGIKNEGGLNSSANSYANVVKKPTGVKETIDGTPIMVLDESCLNNEEFHYACWEEETMKAFHGNKYVGSWFSQNFHAHKEFVIKERVIWVEIEGFICKWWSKNTFNRISSRWESFKMVYRGKTCWVRAIDVLGWVPDFEDDYDDDDDFESNDGTQVAEGPGESVGKCSDLKGKSDSEAISETRFEDEPMDKFDDINSIPHNQDRNDADVDANESTCSGHFKKYTGPRTGGSIIQLIEDLVNVGQTMGYDMTGCMKNMENIIESQGVVGSYR
nr:hypothetical protein [Tanacetum cinerariifolium]